MATTGTGLAPAQRRRTTQVRPAEVRRQWFVMDAAGQVLGRLASRVATVLMGKHHPRYTPHVDTGDVVVVVNAAKVHLTGNKLVQMRYRYWTGYTGGGRTKAVSEVLAKRPEEVIRLAVKRMLPKGPLGQQMIKKLKAYGGPEHPHVAQRPKPLAVRWGASAAAASS